MFSCKKSVSEHYFVPRDLSSLEESVWEGCGGLLLTQRTTSTKVSKLLEAVPQYLVRTAASVACTALTALF